jgi:hypothetical protein
MKTVREIAVKLENKPGILSSISELLGANGINILGLTVRTDGNAGIMNFVVTDPTRVVNILESAGYQPTVKEIIAAEVPHHPGGLNAVLKPLRVAGVNVEYLYSCIAAQGAENNSIVLLGVNDVETAQNALAKEWIRMYGEELYNF